MTWSIARSLLIVSLFAGVIPAADPQQASISGNASATPTEGRDSPTSNPETTFDLLPGEDPDNRLVSPFLNHLAGDQKQFWTRPTRLSKKDLGWMVPFAGMTAGFIAGDSWIAKQVPDKPNQLKRSTNISNYAVYSLIGTAGGAYFWGHLTHNDHLADTGFLSGEAALNSTIVAYAFKEATRRQRPFQGNGNGDFFHSGTSFPSEHSAIAWSVASVVAHEYPGPLTKFMAYGLASAVTLTRATSKQHFASDAVVGTALGWYFGRQIYRAHHDPELGGAAWGDLVESKEKGPRNPENMGSPDVPIDSWVYPALERLAALGYVQTAYLGMRPWTRLECARFLEEADERMQSYGVDGGEAQELLAALQTEFGEETASLNGAANLGASLDSIYTRVTGISGTPLRDGYHFGQTIINDYGRPYSEGFNNVTGFTSRAVAGPLSFSVQGEYQQSPAVASDPASVLQAIANADGGVNPLPDGSPTINRLNLLEASVGLTLKNIRISFGRQSVWLGPGESGPLLLSNNAEPITMLQVDNVSPFQVPVLSRVLGPARLNFFIGELSEQHWVFNGTNLLGPNLRPQPFIHENKISFKPTPNLEFGMGVTAIFGGPGLPFTWSEFFKSYYGHTASTAANPAKRFSSFDFSYRVPGVRNWLTVYNDSLVGDEISPIGSTRPMLNPGLYFPRLPRMPKLELRVEGFKHSPVLNVMYIDRRYRSGYTNDGNLLGSWIGRDGIGGQAWAKYSFSPRTDLQLGYRHQEVDKFLARGGRLNDFSAGTELMLTRQLAFSGSVQYEQWNFPVLRLGPQSDVTASVQLTYSPRWKIKK
jgi:hypothetical protein